MTELHLVPLSQANLYGLGRKTVQELAQRGAIRAETRCRPARKGWIGWDCEGTRPFWHVYEPDIAAHARQLERKKRGASETSTARSVRRQARDQAVSGTLVPLLNADRQGLAPSTVKHLAADGVIAAEKREDSWKGRWFVDEADIAAYVGERGRSSVDSWGLRPFQEHLLARGYTHATAISYPQQVIPFLQCAEQRGIQADRATADEVASYYVSSLDRLKHNTAYVRVKALRVYFEWLRARGIRPDNPVDGIKPRREKLQPRAPFSPDELRALFQAAGQAERPDLALRNRVLLSVLLSTGIRGQELAALQVRDIDWGSGLIGIHGKGLRRRDVVLGGDVLSALRRYIEGRVGPVWLSAVGTPLTRREIYNIIRRLAGMGGVPNATTHRFRVTYACRFLEQSGDLQALQLILGHADISMTAHYAAYTARQRALVLQRQMALGDTFLTSG